MNRIVAPGPRPAIYQDALDAPPNLVAEFIDGALHLRPRPAFLRARASMSFGIEIGGPFDRGRGGTGDWWILFEPELHFGPNVLVPDLAGWRRERMPAFPADVASSELAPDWVCEVLNPRTRRLDLTDKRRLHVEAGVAHLLVRRSDRVDARGLHAPRRRLGARRRTEGRRGGADAAVRGGRLSAWRPLARLSARS